MVCERKEKNYRVAWNHCEIVSFLHVTNLVWAIGHTRDRAKNHEDKIEKRKRKFLLPLREWKLMEVLTVLAKEYIEDHDGP